MRDKDPESIRAWTSYWRKGKAASCFDGSDTELQLRDLWNEFVEALPNGAALLDLATGNGSVARTCAARARTHNPNLRIIAIDAADIDPPRDTGDPAPFVGIAFKGGVRCESLPFDDGEFDGIVSQFGFEYADEEAAAAEATRVLAPGGRLRFVIHARDGAVVQDIDNRLKRLQRVLTDDGPLALVLALVHAHERGDSTALEREIPRLEGAAGLLRELAQYAPRDDAALFYAGQFVQAWSRHERYAAAELCRSLEDGFAAARALARRQEQMLRVARSARDMHDLHTRLVSLGLSVAEPAPVHDDRTALQIAWRVDAVKPAPGTD